MALLMYVCSLDAISGKKKQKLKMSVVLYLANFLWCSVNTMNQAPFTGAFNPGLVLSSRLPSHFFAPKRLNARQHTAKRLQQRKPPH